MAVGIASVACVNSRAFGGLVSEEERGVLGSKMRALRGLLLWQEKESLNGISTLIWAGSRERNIILTLQC